MTRAGVGLSVVRRPAVAGSFYPAGAGPLATLVGALLDEAARRDPEAPLWPAGILVPHAGLVYSGLVAAAAWRLAAVGPDADPPLVVVLGTNHVDPWLDGVAVWRGSAWQTPLGDVAVDEALAAEIAALGGPIHADLDAHAGEHSIEVQLPFVRAVTPLARIVPLAVSAGREAVAIDAGRAIGELLAARALAGDRVLVVISTDMAHYPPAPVAERITKVLSAPLAAVDPVALAEAELAVTRAGTRGVSCGMCGIQPAVLGLATLRAMGVSRGQSVLAATSADAGGPTEQTVGYLAMRFDR